MRFGRTIKLLLAFVLVFVIRVSDRRWPGSSETVPFERRSLRPTRGAHRLRVCSFFLSVLWYYSLLLALEPAYYSLITVQPQLLLLLLLLRLLLSDAVRAARGRVL